MNIRAVSLHLLWLMPWLAASAASAQLITTTLALKPGWNAIYLDVEPTNGVPGVLFAGVPVESAWSYVELPNPVEFLKSQQEPSWNGPSWRRWFPDASPNAAINSLFAIQARTPYFLKLTASATLTVTGRPSYQPTAWVADAFNLRGFPIDPNVPVTFDAFFAPAAAHAGQAIYRLSPTGAWEQAAGSRINDQGFVEIVPGTGVMQPGEAYWVFSAGGSDYVAPLSLQLGTGDSLDFGTQLTERSLEFRNASSSPLALTLRLAGGGATPLTYFSGAAAVGNGWSQLPASWKEVVPAGASLGRRLSVQRSLIRESYSDVMEITDGRGTRFRLGVSVRNDSGAGGASPYAGLWVGEAALNSVTEANPNINPGATVTPTVTPSGAGSEFPLRFLVHVDNAGTVRLLKEVIQLWMDGSYLTDPASGLRTVDTNNPGRFVLLTDDTRIPEFKGVALRDGSPVGRRICSVGLDFAEQPGQPTGTRLMHGSFGPGSLLSCQFQLGELHPTNPFLHRRHPDHAQGFAITRAMELSIFPKPPASMGLADYGNRVLAGAYRETVTGLHRVPITTTGTLKLTRASSIGDLNP